MRTQYLPCIIFSVDLASNSETSNTNSRLLAENDMVNMDIAFDKVVGVYNGSMETSYIVTDQSKFKQIIGMAREFQQESILLRDNENNCTLQFLSNPESTKFLSIGKLEAIHETEACELFIKGGSYTYSPKLRQYFTCR